MKHCLRDACVRFLKRGSSSCAGRGSGGACALSLALGCLLSTPVFAADTIEVWEPGALDVEFYGGYERSLDGPGGNLFSGETVVGVGLPYRLSALVALGSEYQSGLEEPEFFPSVGLFWTALETAHWDLDLLLGLASDGSGELFLEPAFELNWDSDPEMAGLGAYLRGGCSLPGVGAPMFNDPHSDQHNLDWEFTLGSYLRATQDIQLLLEYAQVFHEVETQGLSASDPSSLALGWNHTLSDQAELIIHIQRGFKSESAPRSWAGSLGVILTL